MVAYARRFRRSAGVPVRKLVALVALFAVLVAAAAACSSDDDASSTTTTSTTVAPEGDDAESAEPPADLDGATEEDYVAAITEGLTGGDPASGALVFEPDEGACVAQAWTEAVTVETFQENQVAPSMLTQLDIDFSTLGLSAATAREMVDAFDGCEADLTSRIIGSVTFGASDEIRTCAVENVDPELVEDLVLTAFSTEAGDNDEAVEALRLDLAAQCELDD